MIKPFDNITLKNKEKLLKLVRSYTVNYVENKKIMEFFKDDDEFGIITKGYIQIRKISNNGNIIIIDELEEDSLISSSLFYTKSDEYEIITKEPTQLLIFSYKEIINLDITDKYYIQFVKNLFNIVNSKIIERNERIEIISKKNIREKLLEYFNINSKKSGSRYIYLPFNFTDLANYLAVDRSAMSRELNALKKEGFIEVKGKRICLLYR